MIGCRPGVHSLVQFLEGACIENVKIRSSGRHSGHWYRRGVSTRLEGVSACWHDWQAAGGLFDPPIKDALFVFPSSHVEGKTKCRFQQKDTSPLNSVGMQRVMWQKMQTFFQQIWKSEKGRLGLFLFLFLLSHNVATLGTVCDRHANNWL